MYKTSFTRFGEPKQMPVESTETTPPSDSRNTDVPPPVLRKPENQNARTPHGNPNIWVIVWGIIAIILVVTVIATLVQPWNSKHPAETTESGITATSSSSTSETTIPTTPQDIVKNDLGKGSWIEGQDFTFDPDPSRDLSSTGDGAINKNGSRIETPAEMTKWLASGTKNANAMLNYIIQQTGASREEVLNPSNWIEIQSLIDFTYPGNTMLSEDGAIVETGKERPGKAGDIFFAFVNPTDRKIIYVRGACTNPQVIPPCKPTPTPTPTTPTPTPTLKPKDPSQDPAAKGKAPDGSGKNADLGPGTYVPPEVKVTPAETSRVNPTQPTTTELAPGASPTPTPAPKPTSPTTAPAATPTPVPTHDGTVPSSPWG